jgi:hypothetical protein
MMLFTYYITVVCISFANPASKPRIYARAMFPPGEDCQIAILQRENALPAPRIAVQPGGNAARGDIRSRPFSDKVRPVTHVSGLDIIYCGEGVGFERPEAAGIPERSMGRTSASDRGGRSVLRSTLAMSHGPRYPTYVSREATGLAR